MNRGRGPRPRSALPSSPVRSIDAHGHLNADRFAADVDAVIDRARQAGVARLLVPGWNVASSERALDLAERHPWLDASVGVHPHDAAKVDEVGWASIERWARDERVVAIGETGLDFDRVFSPIDAQLDNLRRNLALAVEMGKPAVLHCRSRPGARDAQDRLLEEVAAVPGVAVVIHSFSGPVDYARAMLGLGAAISISGLAFRRGEDSTAQVISLVPPHRLLVETDSPFLSPPGAPRGRNEPAWVRITADWARELRGQDARTFGDQLVTAYDRTFPRDRARPADPCAD